MMEFAGTEFKATSENRNQIEFDYEEDDYPMDI